MSTSGWSAKQLFGAHIPEGVRCVLNEVSAGAAVTCG